jgi:hypothetical protein
MMYLGFEVVTTTQHYNTEDHNPPMMHLAEQLIGLLVNIEGQLHQIQTAAFIPQ